MEGLGHSLKHLIELLGELENRGVAFRSLQEALDTTSPGGKLVFHNFGSLAEFERNLIRKRTQAALTVAKALGRKRGRPKRLGAVKRKMAVKLHREENHSVQELRRLVSASKPTLNSYFRQSA